eukprot:g7014.t1
MASVSASPPKPYEADAGSGASSNAAPLRTSTVPPQETTSSSLENQAGVTSTPTLQNVQTNPYNSGTFGSGLSSYNNVGSMYGNMSGMGMYGGGMHGNNMMGGYGMGYGGMMGGPMAGMPGGIMGGAGSLISNMEQSVMSFGRISQLLQMNFQGLHMAFMSVQQLLGHASMLQHEMASVIRTFTTFRILHLAFLKMRNMLRALFGAVGGKGQGPSVVDLEEVWQKTEGNTLDWVMPACLTFAFAWWCVSWLRRKRTAATAVAVAAKEGGKDADPQQQTQQQQQQDQQSLVQQQQQQLMFQQQQPFGFNMNYGMGLGTGLGGYGMGGYGTGMPGSYGMGGYGTGMLGSYGGGYGGYGRGIY